MNFGGSPRFVKGACKPRYELGTYGIDPRKKTAWAVINYNGDFAVVGFSADSDRGAHAHKRR